MFEKRKWMGKLRGARGVKLRSSLKPPIFSDLASSPKIALWPFVMPLNSLKMPQTYSLGTLWIHPLGNIEAEEGGGVKEGKLDCHSSLVPTENGKYYG